MNERFWCGDFCVIDTHRRTEVDFFSSDDSWTRQTALYLLLQLEVEVRKVHTRTYDYIHVPGTYVRTSSHVRYVLKKMIPRRMFADLHQQNGKRNPTNTATTPQAVGAPQYLHTYLTTSTMSSQGLLSLCIISCILSFAQVSGYAFVAKKSCLAQRSSSVLKQQGPIAKKRIPSSSKSSSLQMIDSQILMGGGVAIFGLAVGLGMVAFTESQGERGKERGGGLSDRMATSITGGLMEDVEVSSVEDLGSLTSQLEAALKQTGAEDAQDLEMSEEEKERIKEELEDGW